MDSYQRFDTCALVAWKPGELAIFLPLRHDLASLDVPSPDREWACKYIRARNLAVRCLSHNQRHSYVAISLDRSNPAVTTTNRHELTQRIKNLGSRGLSG